MKTVVYQSYRVSNVPPWIARCMESVRAWAAGHGFEYRFVDDRLFEYAPAWYREKVSNNILLVSDLARLKLARELLAEGYERTVWVDADILVFDPERLAVEVTSEYAFCREIWVWRGKEGRIESTPPQVNNSVTVFTRGNSALDFLIHATEALVRKKSPPFKVTDVGTALLSLLDSRIGLPLLRQVGTLGPDLLLAVARDTEDLLRAYMQKVGGPLCAANLCGSFQTVSNHRIALPDNLYDDVIAKIVNTRGAVLNRYT